MISIAAGIIAAVTAILSQYIAVIAGVLTSLTTLASVFVGDYEEAMTWADLNKRQQTYLQAVYELDQAQKAVIKSEAARGNR